jgi:hypothetical protein
MMLWIGLIAVCLWAATGATILGVIASLILVPILGRASRIVRRRKSLGRPADSTTWVLAIAGSIGPVCSTWVRTVMAGLLGCWTVAFLNAWLVALFPHLRNTPTANRASLIVMASVGVLAACATFYRSAIHSWAIQEREVGRIPGSPRHPGVSGKKPAKGTLPRR